MNTIAIPALFESSARQTTVALPLAPAPARPAPQWLPAPPPRPASLAAGRPAKRLSMPSSGMPLAEKCLFGVLVAAAGVGISYGFLCLVELVQNWALFNAAVARMTS